MTQFIIYKSQEIMTRLEISFPLLMPTLALDKVCQINQNSNAKQFPLYLFD